MRRHSNVYRVRLLWSRHEESSAVTQVLLINTVRIEFSLGLQQLGAALSWWRSDWDLRIPGRRLIPDAVFSITWPDGRESTFALEAENNTRSLRGFRRKLFRYAGGNL